MECNTAITNISKLLTFLSAAAVMRGNLMVGFINSNILWKRLPFVFAKLYTMLFQFKQHRKQLTFNTFSVLQYRISGGKYGMNRKNTKSTFL